MKRFRIHLLAWPVLFALGWWAGSGSRREVDASGGNDGKRERLESGREPGGEDFRPERGEGTSTGGTFSTNRTFRDGARGWLLEQSAAVGEDSDPGLGPEAGAEVFHAG